MTETVNIPKRVRLDICNLCQLDCVKCYVRENEEFIKKHNGFGYMKFETFKDFVDQNSFIEEIELSNNGEIFLNPDLLEIIMYAHSKGISLTADNGVNLNHLPKHIAEALVQFNFKSISVSIDAATPETYAIYRRKGDFNKVIENIKLINHYKETYNSIFPFLNYKFIVFGHNEHEIEQAKELAKELNMGIFFDVNFSPEYSPLKDPERVKELTGINTLESQLHNFCDFYRNGGWFYCLDLTNCPQIDWNGDFFGCCTRICNEFKFNVFEDGLINILNSEKIQYAKKMLKDFSVPPREDIPCSDCKIYKHVKEINLPIF